MPPEPLHTARLLCLLAVAGALLLGGGGLAGAWSVEGAERPWLLGFSFLNLLPLLGAALLNLRWAQHSGDAGRLRLAGLSLASLLLCMVGDVINFNLPGVLQRHGGVVQHDYLADSVWAFAPGYALLLLAVFHYSRPGLAAPQRTWALLLALAALLGLASWTGLRLPGSGAYVSWMTGSYSIVITAVGLSAIPLLLASGGRRAPALAWGVAAGLVLALLADALIGQFWLFGRGGEGHFPAVRDANWIVYIGSQALVLQLPRLPLPGRP